MTHIRRLPTPTVADPREGRLRVLMLSRHPDMPGGVAKSTALLKQRLSSRTEADSFIIGRRPAERGVHQALRRLVADNWRFLRLLWSQHYDVIHLNPSLGAMSLLREGVLLLILRLTGRHQVFVFLRGWDWSVARRISGSQLARRLFRFLFGRVARIAVMSATFREALVELGLEEARITIVPSMFDGPALTAAKADEEPVKRRALILFMARFVDGKGAHETIEAFASVATRFPEARLVMAGDGAQRAALVQRVDALGLADRVDFPGYVSGRDKARLLLETDVFVLPSTYGEGLPNALLEAMAAGAAVIVSNAGGMAEVVQAPENGIVLAEVNTAAIAGAIAELLANPSRVALAGATNAATAWAQFESAVVAQRIEAIYEAVAAERAAA